MPRVSSAMIRNLRFYSLLIISLITTVAGHALATEKLNRSARVEPALARAASSAPSPDEALTAARQRLDNSLKELTQFLAQGGSQKELGWRQWLNLPGLETALTHDPPQPLD